MTDDELDGEFRPMPNQVFFILADENLNGSLDISSEGKTPMQKTVAVDQAKQQVDNNGGVSYVVECRTILRVKRGKMQVNKVTAR